MGSALMTLAMTSRRGYVYGQRWKKGTQRGRNTPLNKTANSGAHIHTERPEHCSSHGFSVHLDIQSDQQLHASVSPDTWHRRMGHIGPLSLYKLGKECLGVKLKGKSMSQCPHCALSKITQQISRRPPANKSTKPFHRVFVDWQNLEEG